MGKYDKLIEFILNHDKINYSDLYMSELPEDIDFQNKHLKLLESIQRAKKQGAKIHISDQDHEFEHIIVNKNFKQIPNKARFYLCPTRKNLLSLVIEIVNRSFRDNQRTYIKYCQTPERLDQLIFYLEDSADIDQKLDMLKNIKKDKPELFQGMSQAPIWINETSVPNVYLQANPMLNDRLGRTSSYGNQCQYALEDTKKILEYLYGVTAETSLISHKSDSSFENYFTNVFEEMLRRYGIRLIKGQDGKLYNDKVNGIKGDRPISRFEYDKKTGILTEIRNEKMGDAKPQEDVKEWCFGQSLKAKSAFMQYLTPRSFPDFDDDSR